MVLINVRRLVTTFPTLQTAYREHAEARRGVGTESRRASRRTDEVQVGSVSQDALSFSCDEWHRVSGGTINQEGSRKGRALPTFWKSGSCRTVARERNQ